MEPRVSPSGDLGISKKYIAAAEGQKRYKTSQNSKSAGDWFPLGYTEWNTDSYNPGNGRVNLIVKDPNNSSIFYAGTPAGGLWRTNDEFETWQPLTDDLPTLGVSGICINPSNSNIIYLATGDGDGGDTYSNGVLKSLDAGATWQTTGLSYLVTTEVRINKLVMHPNNPEILFAASRNGLWKTVNGGEVWYEVQSGNVNDVEFKPNSPNVVYCTTNRIYISEDTGENFENSSTGMPSPGNVEGIELGVSADNPEYLYALCVDDSGNDFLGLFRSENSGVSFTERSNSPNVLGYSPDGGSDGGQGMYNLALDVDPNNAERLFLGGINVWRSINGGQDFILNSYWVYDEGTSQAYVHADIHNIHYIDESIFVCSDGGVFRSTNNGSNFTDVSVGLQIAQFYRIGGYEDNENLLLGGTQDNGSIKLSGLTWTHELGADGMEAAIHPANPDVMYISSQFGNIRKSLDGGVNWTSATVMLNDDGGWVTPYALHPQQEGTIYAGFTEIWKSTTNGESYEQLSDFNSGNQMRDMAISNSNPNVIYACTENNLYKTENEGDTWQTAASGLAPTFMTYVDVNPIDENDAVVSYSGFIDGRKIYRTLDGGQTWDNISFNLPNIPVNCVVIDSDNGSVYAGTDLGIYYLDSELLGWIPFSDGLPNVIVTEMELNNSLNQITAATYGRGIWRSSQFDQLNEEPTALFEADKQIICVGDSIEFSDLSYGHLPGWDWSFSGADETNSSEQSPVITYSSPGFYEVSLSVFNDTGESTHTETAYIIVQAATETYPYTESFENGTLLETYEFTSLPVSGDIDWKINESVGYTGNQCLWVQNGVIDEPYETEIYSKQFDFSNQTDSVWLSFKYAYAQRHEDNDDRLRFFTSNNCGQNFQLKEQLRGTQELNTIENVQIGEFIPEDFQWETFSYLITGTNLSEAFSFKLRLTGDNGNHLYIDDINLGDTDLTVLENPKEENFLVFPNPVRDELNLKLELKEEASLKLVNQLGQEVRDITGLRVGLNVMKLALDDLEPGIYFLNLVSVNGKNLRTEKIIIN